MDPDRKHWNENQQALRRLLARPADHSGAVELFLEQHASLHAAAMTRAGGYSLDDDVWEGLTEEAARRVLPKGGHSIAWMIWHIARIEDITMNILVAGGRQILDREDWHEKMRVAARDTGNAMDAGELAALSAAIDLEALRAYRLSVGRRTREIVARLQPGQVQARVDPRRLQRVKDEGAVPDQADWLLRYWGGLTIAGLLLMPPTRHNFVHLNEAVRARPRK